MGAGPKGMERGAAYTNHRDLFDACLTRAAGCE
jgi:hypothetical protein